MFFAMRRQKNHFFRQKYAFFVELLRSSEDEWAFFTPNCTLFVRGYPRCKSFGLIFSGTKKYDLAINADF